MTLPRARVKASWWTWFRSLFTRARPIAIPTSNKLAPILAHYKADLSKAKAQIAKLRAPSLQAEREAEIAAWVARAGYDEKARQFICTKCKQAVTDQELEAK